MHHHDYMNMYLHEHVRQECFFVTGLNAIHQTVLKLRMVPEA